MFDKRSIPLPRSGGNYNAMSANFGNLQEAVIPLALLGAAYFLLSKKKEGDTPINSVIGGGYSGGYAAGTGAASVGAGVGSAVVGAIDGATQVGADLIAAGINAATGGTHATGSAIIKNIQTLTTPAPAPAMVIENVKPVLSAAESYISSVTDKAIKSGGAASFAAFNSVPDSIPITKEAVQFNQQKAAYSGLIAASKSGSTSSKVVSLAKVAAASNPVISGISDVKDSITGSKYTAAVVGTQKAVLKTVLSGTGITKPVVKTASVVSAVKKVSNYVKVLAK